MSVSLFRAPIAPRRRVVALALAAALAVGLLSAVHAPSVAQAATAPVNLAQEPGVTASASSTSGAAYAPSFAVDGDTSTRWASKSGPGTRTLTVELAADATITGFSINWARYAKSYRIETSANGSTWTTAFASTKGKGGTSKISFTGTARYVRLVNLVRGTTYGYSVSEFRVYGPAVASTTGVHVTGTQGDWQLAVDGKPYYVKGVTYDPSNTASTALPDIASMGANTIRTWGTTDSSGALFDEAADNGIRVIAGFWLEPSRDYATDTAYKQQQLSLITSLVEKYKGDDGVLMWDVGNEVMQNKGTDAAKTAYAKYLETVVEAIHAIDPDHPVTTTEAQTSDWKYYKADIPSLDLYAVNTYGGISSVQSDWEKGGYDRPYIVTESGTKGNWEVSKDSNGVPVEPTDTEKAGQYTSSWNDIVGDTGVSLGATMFNYGPPTDDQGLWFSLLPGGLRTAGYYAVKDGFTGDAAPALPTLSKLTVPASAVAGSTFTVSAKATDANRAAALTYTALMDSRPYTEIDSLGGTLPVVVADNTSNSTGSFTITAPTTPGVYKYYVQVVDGLGNVSHVSASVKVVAAN